MRNSSDAATEACFDRLRVLRADCGPNKNDQAVALISACILEGRNTDDLIVGALGAIGMHPGHVRITLEKGTGVSPDRHFWRRDGEGRYRLHEAVEPA